MSTTSTPLRYPGGKSKLVPIILGLLKANNLTHHNYCEPFAGGAGIAINLITNNHVKHVFINDYDPAIYAFWRAALENNEQLIDLIMHTDITIDEWHRQREIFFKQDLTDFLSLGFATLFLNRTNRSGILKAGVIGGKSQSGMYKIDCRFNKVGLIKKIEKIKMFRSNISLFNHDAVYFIENIVPNLPNRTLINLDPPYYEKGHELYTNFYTDDDHIKLFQAIQKIKNKPWLVTYDDVYPIRKLYQNYSQKRFSITYSAQTKRLGSELMIFGPKIINPEVTDYLMQLDAA